VNESCHKREWGMLHRWIRYVTRIYACLPQGWVMSYVTLLMCDMCESCHTYTRVIHTYTRVMCRWVIRHITHMNESCHTYEWVMSHIWMSHVTLSSHTYICLICHIYTCVLCLSRVTLICVCDMSLSHKTYHTYEWVMSHCHVTLIYVLMSQLYVCDMSSSCHTYTCDVSWIDKSYHTYEWVMSDLLNALIHMSYKYRVAKTHRIP